MYLPRPDHRLHSNTRATKFREWLEVLCTFYFHFHRREQSRAAPCFHPVSAAKRRHDHVHTSSECFRVLGGISCLVFFAPSKNESPCLLLLAAQSDHHPVRPPGGSNATLPTATAATVRTTEEERESKKRRRRRSRRRREAALVAPRSTPGPLQVPVRLQTAPWSAGRSFKMNVVFICRCVEMVEDVI